MTAVSPFPYPTPLPSSVSLPRARSGFWRRFGAHLIDAIAINILALPTAFIASPLLSTLALAIVFGVYYTSLEGGARGQTIGKMALGIRVADIDGGGSIGYGRACIRAYGRIVSATVFCLGYLWMLWDSEKQTWHDKMARSVVVPAD